MKSNKLDKVYLVVFLILEFIIFFVFKYFDISDIKIFIITQLVFVILFSILYFLITLFIEKLASRKFCIKYNKIMREYQKSDNAKIFYNKLKSMKEKPIGAEIQNTYFLSLATAAYKNGEKITVNDYELDDMKTVCHYDLWPEADYNISKVLQELGNKTYIIGLGSIIRACMCVASGDFTLAIFPGTKHKNCDIAAVKVIVEEAGGTVTDLFGNEQRYDESINGAVISNGKVHNEVTETVKKYLKDRK